MRRLVLFAALMCSGCAGCVPNYSNGDRIGVVTKLSEKGWIFKSWEGDALIALPAGVSAIEPEHFLFNVDPPAVPKVKAAMVSGKRVRLVYRQWAVTPVSIDNDHVVIDVTDVQ